jgi:hypothetical protein
LALAVLNVLLMTAVNGCCLLLGVLFDHLGDPNSNVPRDHLKIKAMLVATKARP